MAQDPQNQLLVQIRDLIEDTFSLEEFRDLCFRLGVKYDNLRGESLSARILDLVEMMRRQRRLGDLLNFCARLRPNVEWPDLPDAVNLGAAPAPVTTPERNPRQIFLSHARQDAEFAHRLAADLSRHEWEVWIAPDSIRSGEGWVDAINRGLAESGIFLLVLTPDAVNSKWVHSETNVAIGLQHENLLRFIPLDVKQAAAPPLWKAYQWVSFQSGYKAGLEQLLQELQPEKMRPLARLYRQLQAAVGRREWAQVQKLGAEINAQYPDYRETETLSAMAEREEAREQRRQAETHAQRQQEKARLQQQQEEARAQKRREEELAQRKQTEAAQLYARLRTDVDKADWDAALTLADQIETLLPGYRDVKQLAARARRGQKQDRRAGFTQTLRQLPIWGWIGGLVVVALAVFGVFQLINGDGGEATITPTTSATLQSTDTSQPTNTPMMTPASALAPGIGSARIRPKDEAVMVYVPGGTFMMGSSNAEIDKAFEICEQALGSGECQRSWFEHELPQHLVSLDSFWIDQTEVTNGMYAQCVDTGVCRPPEVNESYTRSSYYGNIEFDNFPVIEVSWEDAKTYCEWVDGRLPTEAEWEKASRWDENAQEAYTYPWGNDFDGTRLNFCDSSCPFDGWKDDTVNDGYEDTAPVGSYPEGNSPYGALDMAGNVWEWTADWYNGEYYKLDF